jgi:hypothetical protein
MLMHWKIVERKLGRAGDPKQRAHRQHEWDKKYGVDNWQIGYLIDGEFISQEDAFHTIYCGSYTQHFSQHPEDLEELLSIAKKLNNPHAEATKGVDLQVPAILHYLKSRGLELKGTELVDIGSWKNQYSHKISIRLSPLHIKVVGDDRMTLEQYWQEKKVLAVWMEE